MQTTAQPSRTALARRVRAARAYSGLSPAQLAVRAHLNHASVVALERGSYRICGDELDRIAAACGVEPELLIHGEARLP